MAAGFVTFIRRTLVALMAGNGGGGRHSRPRPWRRAAPDGRLARIARRRAGVNPSNRPASGARALVFGAGATGARVARLLGADPRVGSVEVRDTDADRLDAVLASLGPSVSAGEGPDVPADLDAVVVATTTGTQAGLARRALASGVAVVTTSDDIAETRELLAADSQARTRGVPLVVGAGFMPGFTCLLAGFGAAEFDHLDEVHVAKAGTGGPACARQHHRALSSPGHRLARRPMDAPGRRVRPRTVLVPRPGGRARLLSGRAARCPAAGARLRWRRPSDSPDGGHPARPADRAAADDAPAPPRRRCGRGASGDEGLAAGRASCVGPGRPSTACGRRSRGGGLHCATPSERRDRSGGRWPGVRRRPGRAAAGGEGSRPASLPLRGVRAVPRDRTGGCSRPAASGNSSGVRRAAVRWWRPRSRAASRRPRPCRRTGPPPRR